MKENLLKSLVFFALSACTGSVQTPRNDTDAALPEPADTVEPEVEFEAEATETVEEATEEVIEVIEETAVPLTIAQKFAAADGQGGQKLCLGMFYALSPEWDVSICRRAAADEGSYERCERQRRPLTQLAEKICKTVIEESLALNLDPGLALADGEREASWGRVRFNVDSRLYQVDWDICKMFLSTNRIVDMDCAQEHSINECRWTSIPPDMVAGVSEKLMWTWAEDRVNVQTVKILGVEAGGLRIDTCAHGEAGAYQNLLNDYSGRRGLALGLRGNAEERRRQLLADPVAQIRLGLREIARHRDICPEAVPERFETYLGTYNVGRCRQALETAVAESETPAERARWQGLLDKWIEYTTKVLRHYQDSCRHSWFNDAGGSLIMVRDAWPECARVDSVLASFTPEN